MSASAFWELTSADQAVAVARRLRAIGFHDLEAYTPFEVRELESLLGIRRSRIPVVGSVFAFAGGLVAYLIIWFCNAYDSPLDVGGRPLDSLPADVPIMFETAVLLSALAIFVAMILRSGMPRLHRPVFEIDGFERTSIDRYWIGVDEHELSRAHFERALSAIGADPIWRREG